MAAWTKADFARIVPEMSSVDQTTFDFFAALADAQLHPTRFTGSRRILAGCYFTAHLISVSPPAGVSPQGAPVSSESVGGVSVSYATGAARALADLNLSRYGVALQRLLRFAGAGGFVP